MQTIITEPQYEIERGKPMPSKNHAFVQGNLYFHLRSMFEQFQILPEISLQLSSSEKVPDLAIFDNIEFTPGNDEIRVKQTPLAVIEILSPKQNLGDLLAKAHIYFENDIKSYWLILPDLKSIYVFKSPQDYVVFLKKELLKDDVLGIELDLGKIFG
ncbi:MAG: Uma2 family endonuclease [Saprospiraceae bacterium]